MARLLVAATLVLLGLMMAPDADAQAPDAPTIDTVTPRAGWLLVEWSAPANVGGSTIIAYDLRHIETSADETVDSNWTTVEDIWTTGGGELRYRLDALTDGTGYDVQVRAVNSDTPGDGAWSTTVAGTPESSEETAATLVSVRGDDGALAVKWKAPATLVDAGTTHDLRYIETDATDKSDSEWTEVAGAGIEGRLLHGITGVTNGTEYDVQARAVDSFGNGPWSATITATPADPGQDLENARDISLETTSSGELDPMGGNYFWGRIDASATGQGVIHSSDWDYFKLVITDTQAPDAVDFEIFTQGSLDTSGTLFDNDGNAITSNNQGVTLPEPHNFHIQESLEAGTYFIRVIGSASETGEYVLRIVPDDDPTSPTDAADLVLGGRVYGTINPPDESDYFELELTERTDVILRAIGTLNTTGELLDENDVVLASNNDGNLFPKTDGFLIRRTLDAGTYSLKVSSHRGVSSGGYTVLATDAGNPGNAATDAQALTFDDAAGGNITSTSDADYFSITVDDTTYVQIWAAPNDSGADVDAGLLDSSETAVDADFAVDFSGHFKNIIGFGIAHKLDAGTHYVKVTGDGNSTGRYTIVAVEEVFFAMLVEDCKDISRGGISDVWYGCQWHLQDDGMFGAGSINDINVEGVWSGGNLGAGIHVAVVDDGMHHQHEDLTDNVDTSKNHDYTGRGDVYHPFDRHGTSVAGIIAARDNSKGVRGVAPRATIYGYNLLATGGLSDQIDAISRNAGTTAVSNNSWGQGDEGSPELVTRMWDETVENVVTSGYGGKGVFIVWSAGNGAREGDYSTLDERNNFYAVTAVCAVNQEGKRTYYSEKGANLWVCAPSDDSGAAGIATTTNSNRYITGFGGTSAAAPIVSGVAALVRKANDALTWRDVKLILAASARKNDADNDGWETGASKYGDTGTYNFNHEYGFGVVDAQAAVNLADGWTNVPGLRKSVVESGAIDLSIPDATPTDAGTTITSKLTLDGHVEFIEYIQVDAHFDHDSFRDLDVELVSPAGTVSKLAPYFDRAAFGSEVPLAFMDNPFRLGSARHLGENPAGEWTLRVTDHISGDPGVLDNWKITAYGHGTKPTAPEVDELEAASSGFTVTWKAPADAGASAITEYQVHYIRSDASDKTDGSWTSATAGSSARQHTITGLDGNVQYDVRVRAVNSGGNGAWSTTDTVTADSADAPTITSVTSIGRTLVVKWTAPTNSGLGTVASYDLRHKFTNFGDWTVVDSIWTSTSGGPLESTLVPTIFLGLGRSHYVQLRAVVGTTEHPWSASRTLITVPGAPTISGITAVPGGGKMQVQWIGAVSANQFPVTSSDLRYIETAATDKSDANWTLETGVWTRGSGRTGYTIEGLANWVQYDVQVRGVNAGGPGPWSATETGTPSNTSVRVTLLWEDTSVDVDEAGGSVTLKAIATTDRDEALPTDFSFDAAVTTQDGTATNPADYAPLTNATLTFRQSNFERVMTGSGYRYQAAREVNVTIVSDSADETDETFTATLDYAQTDAPNLLGGNSVATVTIRDDEHVPVQLGWLNDAVSVNEGARTVTLDATATTTVDKRPESGFSFQATIATSDGAGSDGAEAGHDYTHVSTTVTFQHSDSWSAVGSGPDRRYRATRRVAVPILNDTADERNENFTATVAYADASPPPHLQGGSANVTVTIEDNDLPTVSVRADTATAEESGVLRFTLARDGVDDDALSVSVRVSETGRMLASGQPATVSFVAGDATATLDVALADDTEDEDNSVVTVSVRSGSGYVPASDSSATATALDNDHVPVTLGWDRTAVTVAERAGTVTLRGVATTAKDKQPESGFSFTATLTATPGTADSSDYTVVTASAIFRQSDFTRTLAGGVYRYRATQDFTVNVASGDGNESDETFTATLSYAGPSQPHLRGGNATATVTISDNDRPLVTINSDAATATEADASVTFTLRRDGPTASALQVNVRVTESGSVLASAPNRVTFDAGSSTANLRVNLSDDTEDEDNSTVTVEVVDGSGYLPGSPSSARTVVADDDHVPVTLEWQETAIAVDEDAGTVTLTALATTTGDKEPESGFTFDGTVAVSDGNATNPADYQPPTDTTLTFNAGGSFRPATINGQNRYQAARTFRVSIEPDDTHEPDENFTARLAYADPGDPHLRGGNSTASVTITDDDPVPLALGWERPVWSVEEDEGSITLRAVAVTAINRQPEDGFSFDASVNTLSGSANPGSDYTHLSRTETFLRRDFRRVTFDGQSRYRAEKEFAIEIVDDGADEPNENFSVRLGYDGGSPHANLAAGVTEATVWIIEDDAATADLQLSRNSSPGGTSQGATLTYEYTVTNNGPATATGLELVVHLDPNVSVNNATLPAGCNHAAGVVTCALGNLNDGGDEEIAIEVTVASAPSHGIVNRAYVRSSVPDPRPGNNTYPSSGDPGPGPGPGPGPSPGLGGGGVPASQTPTFLDADGNEVTATTRMISENAASGAQIGEPVTATDPDGDALTHALTGDDAASFAIDPASGQLTTATLLDYETQPSYTVAVTASDASGLTARVQVTITVSDVDFDCSSANAVAGADDNPALVADCEALLETRDKLAGSRSLNWSEDIPIAQWDGVALGGTPQRVTRLRLHRKGLDGGVPADLSGLTGLVELSLYRNKLTGRIPAALGNLSNLRWLYLHSNKSLESDGLSGPIPTTLGNLDNLELLFLYGNNLSGTIPAELGQLSNLKTLLLHENNLTGLIPAELGRLPRLRYLWLDDNSLSGPIPSELGDLSNLRWLSLYGNELTGPIPSDLADLSDLRLLVLDRNKLSGPIPARLGALAALTWLDLNGNELSGQIPDELGNLANLVHLYLHNNDLTGPIPADLGRLSNLTNLWLRDNHLSGQIPSSLGNLPNLQRVRVAGNQFTGCIPAGLLGAPRWYSDAEELGLPTCNTNGS